MKLLRVIFMAVIVVVLTVVAGKYILLDYYPSVDNSFSYPIQDIRRLASADEVLPDSVGYLVVAGAYYPARGLVAGMKIDDPMVSFVAYQVGYGDEIPPVVIDGAIDKSIYEADIREKVFFDAENYSVLENAFSRAGKILVTHTHYDHIGGIANASNFDAIRHKIHLTGEQAASPLLEIVGMELDGDIRIIDDFARIEIPSYGIVEYALVAPGIVMIKTPGHTPCHASFFIALSDGSEVIISGDVAFNRKGITHQRQKPLLTSYMLGEDRGRVGKDLYWLNQLNRTEGVRIMVSHDLATHTRLEAVGIIREGFPVQ